MNRTDTARPRLRRRLMLAFAAFTALTTGVFGLYAMTFMYVAEDAFFATTLQQEADRLHRMQARDGRWPAPQAPFMQVYTDAAALPDGIGAVLAQQPQRREFAAPQGRHYHLLPLAAADGAPAWLLAEVSAQLVVRPMRVRLLVLLAASTATLLLIGLVLGWWLARRTTAPLTRLVALVENTAVDRLPRDLARGFADDDVGVLARALDALAERMHAFVLREREFTRDASHELRTPLTVIRAAAERLQSEARLSPAGRQQLSHLHQSALQLQQTVIALLTLAREEDVAAFAPTAAQVAVLPLLEQVVIEQAPLLDSKPVEVDVQLARDTCSSVPAALLHILLSNLVGNAFAHATAGTIDIGASDGRLRIANRIDDTDQATLPHLQQAYAKREGSAGFGLGLVIVRRLSDRCGLDLRIDWTGAHAVASFLLQPAPSQA